VSDIETLIAEIRSLKNQIDPLVAAKTKAIAKLETLRSKEFIRVNNITLDDVQHSDPDGTGGIWHGTFMTFGKWMADTKSTKRFCEWNGRIYHTSDALIGRMSHTSGRYEDIPNS